MVANAVIVLQKECSDLGKKTIECTELICKSVTTQTCDVVLDVWYLIEYIEKFFLFFFHTGDAASPLLIAVMTQHSWLI